MTSQRSSHFYQKSGESDELRLSSGGLWVAGAPQWAPAGTWAQDWHGEATPTELSTQGQPRASLHFTGGGSWGGEGRRTNKAEIQQVAGVPLAGVTDLGPAGRACVQMAAPVTSATSLRPMPMPMSAPLQVTATITLMPSRTIMLFLSRSV